MRYGFVLPQVGPMAGPEALITVARRAEELGYDSLWVTERLLFPLSRGRTTHPPLTARSRCRTRPCWIR